MTFQIFYTRTAEKQLAQINDPTYSRIKAAIDALAQDPLPFGYLKLKGRDGFRIRVGDYRIIYTLTEEVLIITIVTIGHRKEVYD